VSFPHIIAFESSHHDELGFPTAMAWTLPSGLYKAVLIQPDEQWLALSDEDATPLERPIHELFELGVHLVDLIAELAADLTDETLYADDPERAENLLNNIYETMNLSSDFNVASIYTLFGPWPQEDIDQVRAQYAARYDLSEHIGEQNVLLWRATYAHLMQETEIMIEDSTNPSPDE
jgi:hypothetical protein